MAAIDEDVCIANAPTPDHQDDIPIEAGLVGGGNLTDPIFQDLDRNSRAYLAHLPPMAIAISFNCHFDGLLSPSFPYDALCIM
ncbi:hypothetical protein J3459_002591 [Metarhizium acridum]|nr:hypothetical protein J3459_002591 [Metarhizium acridum]